MIPATRRITTLTIEEPDNGVVETFRVETTNALALPAVFHVFGGAVLAHDDEIQAVQAAVKLLADVVVLYVQNPPDPAE